MGMDAASMIGRVLPRIRGSSLSGTVYEFPRDLGAATLLLVAFRQAQQADVDSWLPVARRIAYRYPGFAFFEIPLIDRRWRPARRFIDGGMRAGIADESVRASTVTAYQDRRRFLGELGLEDGDHIAVLLTLGAGVIGWAALGPFPGERAAEEIATLVAANTSH